MDPRALHLLVIDDDRVDVMTVERALARSRLNCPLHTASDGIEGLEKLRDGSIPSARRLVLLDLNLPRMNGIEFLAALRADPALQGTSVVVLTTSDQERDKIAAYRFNVAGYLIKPVPFSEFVALLDALGDYWTRVEMP